MWAYIIVSVLLCVAGFFVAQYSEQLRSAEEQLKAVEVARQRLIRDTADLRRRNGLLLREVRVRRRVCLAFPPVCWEFACNTTLVSHSSCSMYMCMCNQPTSEDGDQVHAHSLVLHAHEKEKTRARATFAPSTHLLFCVHIRVCTNPYRTCRRRRRSWRLSR